MSSVERQLEIPTWVVGLVVVLFLASLVYGIVIQSRILAVIVGWVWILGLGVSVFAVYLFYRFVLAVEKIADKL